MCKHAKCNHIELTWDRSWWDNGLDAINRVPHPAWNRGAKPVYYPREWHKDLQRRFKLHPVVDTLLHYRPASWQQVLLEWPHVAEADPTRLAYTRDEGHGDTNRQTITSIGKYIARHWPHVPDHLRRDAACLYSPDTFEWATTTRQMVQAIELGPRSCMTSQYGSIPFSARQHIIMREWMADNSKPEPNWELHPYACYAPKHGWLMALRRDTKEIMGRALVYREKGSTTGVFVRTFMHNPGSRTDFAVADTVLCAWLEAQGYEKLGGWPEGALLECPGGRAPYIDGDNNYVEHFRDDTYAITYDEGHECRNTSGAMSDEDEDEDYFDCEDCGDRAYYDDSYSVGRDEDHRVCSSCFSDYTEVRGQSSRRAYREYRIPDAEAVYIENQDYYIDPENPPDGVVELECRDWADEGDCVCIDDEYYLTDDERIVCCESEDPDTGSNYGLREDCWQETESGDWYHDHIEHVTDADGNLWHPDNAPESEDEDEDEDEDEETPEPAAIGQELALTPAQVHEMMAEVTANLTDKTQDLFALAA